MISRVEVYQKALALRVYFAALFLMQFLALIATGGELTYFVSSHYRDLLVPVLLAIRLSFSVGVLVATFFLYRGHGKGWKWGVSLQLTLVVVSLIHISAADLSQNAPVLLTVSAVFFQIVSLRMFFLRSLVVRYGMKRLKPWFRERRVGTRAHCKLKLVGQTRNNEELDCQLINLSLSGCLFCTSFHLAENQLIALFPEHAPDLVLRVVVKDANHRPLPISPDIAWVLQSHSADSTQTVQFYAGSFEEKLSDEEFNRLLRGESQPGQPQQSA